MRSISTGTRRLAVGLVFAAAASAGCGDSSEPKPAAPDLPPLQSMQMDLSLFTDVNPPKPAAPGFTGTPGSGRASEPAGTKLNFANAVARAVYVNVAVVTVLTPPALAFSAAIHTTPSREEDSWLWIYTWNDGALERQIRLRGTPEGNHVNWELYIVRSGSEPELWFTGLSATDNDSGYWLFRDFTAEGDPQVLRVDWEVNSETDATLELENVFVGNPDEGDNLIYDVEGADQLIEFHDASTSDVWDVRWKSSDHSGSVQVPDYRNGERSCWDANQDDVTCPVTATPLAAARRVHRRL